MKIFTKLFLLPLFCELISCSGHFAIIGSKFLTQNGKYSVSITSQNFAESDTPLLEFAIHSTTCKTPPQTISLINGASQIMEFDMVDQSFGDYNLSVHCIKGMDFNRTVPLHMRIRITVQTDKPVYKPSETVQFRVLILNESLQPLRVLDDTNVQVYITDGAQNRVKQFDDLNFVKGVYLGTFKLSDLPILGNWHVVVIVNKKYFEQKLFKVAEYTLPTVEVIIDTNRHVHIDEKSINVTVVATHTFGKMARGNATITANVEGKKISKAIEVIGKHTVNFDIESDLGIEDKSRGVTINFSAAFTEELTGQVQNATVKVQVHSEPCGILINTQPRKFRPGLQFTVTAMIEYYDKNLLVTTNENMVHFKVEFHKRIQLPDKIVRTTYNETFAGIIENGIAKLDIDLPEHIDRLFVTAKHLQTETPKIKIGRTPSESDHFITITSKTKTPKLNENITISIKSVKHFSEFSYCILTIGGRLIASNTIQVSPTKNFDFEFTPTSDVESEVAVVVFYIIDGEIIRDALRLEFVELKNFVHIQISKNETLPADNVKINISSNQNSFVGIVGIDQSVVLLKEGSDSPVFEKIEDDETSELDSFYILHTGSSSFTYYSSDTHSSPKTVTGNFDHKIKFRKNFPETWLFQSWNFDDNQTHAVIHKKVPDTITSWKIVAFSIHPIKGYAETEQPIKLNVSKPFFTSIDLPYSIQLGDTVSITISVFNYLKEDQDASINFYNEQSEFYFVDETVTGKRNSTIRTKIVHVMAQSGASTSFTIRPNKIGDIKIKVEAKLLTDDGDSVERNLRVKPKGITKEMKNTAFIDLRNNSMFKKNISIYIPHDAIVDSIKIEASIIGDILGLPIGNVDKLLKFPDGTGEQNIINFVSNIVVLDYLTSVNKMTPEIRKNATDNLQGGYQKQLNYKHDDGSFSMWGQSDKSGSTWLTAFVAKSFQQATKYISIETDIIEKSLNFLAQTQSEDGRFVEVGKIVRNDIQGGSSNGMALTAYTLITFLENRHRADKSYQVTIDKALEFLSENVNSITDKYSLAITGYAFQLADHPKKNILLSKLEGEVVKDAETMHWEEKLSESLDIEMTAYALQAFLKADRLMDSARIMKWLVSQRSQNGGFISTQDTMIGLQALSNGATKMYSAETSMEVTIGNRSTMFHVHEWNALILQKQELPSSTRDFAIKAIGKGFSVFQISYQYNIESVVDETGRFDISYSVHKTSDVNTFILEVCTKYIPDEKRQKSDNALMEVQFPSGYTFNTDGFTDFEFMEGVLVKDLKTSVTVFIGELRGYKVCPKFLISKDQHVEGLQTASIIVKDNESRVGRNCDI